MGIIPAGVHRILDYLAVVAFALAPTVFHLVGNTRLLAYALAIVHLVITLVTQFPGAPRRPLAFNVHGVIELVVGILLIAVPLIRHWTYGAHRFYIGMGIAILVIWGLTRYAALDRPPADVVV